MAASAAAGWLRNARTGRKFNPPPTQTAAGGKDVARLASAAQGVRKHARKKLIQLNEPMREARSKGGRGAG
jgi:hypothetical protein